LNTTVLDYVDRDTGVSTRQVEEELNVSHVTIWRVLHEEMLYRFHLHRVQGFMPVDFPARDNFCWCFAQRSAENVFVSSVLFTNEAHFGRNCIINIHNQHQWAEENPHGVIHSRNPQQFSINAYLVIVW
jgi:hypothetical protein